MSLSNKHKEFVNQYLVDFNGTRAAQRSGYSGDDNVLSVTAYNLLRNPKIAEAIQTRLTESAMTADEVLMRLAQQARGDIDDYLDDSGNFDLAKARRAAKTKLIKKFKAKTTVRTFGETEVETTEVEFELYDAQAALSLLGKHHKLFIEQSEVKHSGTMQLEYVNDWRNADA